MISPYEQFEINIEISRTYIKSYKELRTLKGLGSRGALTTENQYLLNILKASIVMSISSLDLYIHQSLLEQAGKVFRNKESTITKNLFELTTNKIYKDGELKDKIKIFKLLIHSGDPFSIFLENLKEELSTRSYQEPDKIIKALELIDIQNIFNSVSESWPGGNTTEKDIKNKLVGYCKRRNQIAHESDLEHTSNKPRPIQPIYANNCIEFVSNLVKRLDKVIGEK